MAFAPLVVGGLVAAGGAAQAIGGFIQQHEDANTLEFESEVDRRNAKLTRQAARSDADDERLDTRRQLGKIRAAYAANGVGGAGTSLDVLEDYTAEGEFDVEKVLYNGEIKAMGLLDSADQKKTAAEGTRSRAGIGLAAGLLGAGAGGANAALNRR